ncbi:hypothetical protein Ciccas_005709 [Cichlidogyrus casuarinus]|uniref:Uncharacterized protein n=1 Tax=Cichlidogyrus casuarinus TaxID=1844966 RepID=A0ABD2QA92_9PLAT
MDWDTLQSVYHNRMRQRGKVRPHPSSAVAQMTAKRLLESTPGYMEEHPNYRSFDTRGNDGLIAGARRGTILPSQDLVDKTPTFYSAPPPSSMDQPLPQCSHYAADVYRPYPAEVYELPEKHPVFIQKPPRIIGVDQTSESELAEQRYYGSHSSLGSPGQFYAGPSMPGPSYSPGRFMQYREDIRDPLDTAAFHHFSNPELHEQGTSTTMKRSSSLTNNDQVPPQPQQNTILGSLGGLFDKMIGGSK